MQASTLRGVPSALVAEVLGCAEVVWGLAECVGCIWVARCSCNGPLAVCEGIRLPYIFSKSVNTCDTRYWCARASTRQATSMVTHVCCVGIVQYELANCQLLLHGLVCGRGGHAISVVRMLLLLLHHRGTAVVVVLGYWLCICSAQLARKCVASGCLFLGLVTKNDALFPGVVGFCTHSHRMLKAAHQTTSPAQPLLQGVAAQCQPGRHTRCSRCWQRLQDPWGPEQCSQPPPPTGLG